MRVLSALSTCLSYSGNPSRIGSVVTLLTLFQALFSLQGSLLVEGDSEGASYVHQLINDVKKTGCEGIDTSPLMQQYEVQLCSKADAEAALDCVIMMALAACIENVSQDGHRHILSNVMTAKVRMPYLLSA
jgi:hypothetical protein